MNSFSHIQFPQEESNMTYQEEEEDIPQSLDLEVVDVVEYDNEGNEIQNTGATEESQSEDMFEYLDQELQANTEMCQMTYVETNIEKVRINMIGDHIASYEHENLKYILHTVPLLQMTKAQQNSYLLFVLKSGYEIQDFEVAKIAIEIWQQYNPGEEKYPITTSLYLIQESPEYIQILKYVDSALNLSYAYHAYKLTAFDSNAQISVAVDRLEKIYGEQPANLYKSIYDMCIEEYEKTGLCNTELLVYMEQKYRENAEVADTPSYMISEDPFYFPFHSELMSIIDGTQEPSTDVMSEELDEQLLQYITGQLDLIPEGLLIGGKENAQKTLVENFKSITTEEKLEQSKGLQTDIELFRILGPANPGILEGGVSDDFDCPCMKYGGHRMFTCYEYENYDADGEIIDESILYNKDYDSIDWFRGSCDNCLKSILFKQRAVRMPVLDAGGWKGCYCSWDCVIEDVIGGPEASLLVTMIKQFNNMTYTNGIYERFWDNTSKAPYSLGFTLDYLEAKIEMDDTEYDVCAEILFPNIDEATRDLENLERQMREVEIFDIGFEPETAVET